MAASRPPARATRAGRAATPAAAEQAAAAAAAAPTVEAQVPAATVVTCTCNHSCTTTCLATGTSQPKLRLCTPHTNATVAVASLAACSSWGEACGLTWEGQLRETSPCHAQRCLHQGWQRCRHTHCAAGSLTHTPPRHSHAPSPPVAGPRATRRCSPRVAHAHGPWTPAAPCWTTLRSWQAVRALRSSLCRAT